MRGDRVQTSVYIDQALLRKLKLVLVLEEISLSEWFREQAQTYVQAKTQGKELRYS